MHSGAPRAAHRAARARAALAALLAAVTVALYAQTGSFGFLPGDDEVYVSENPWVRQGLTWRGLWWALTSLEYANWHPLTWLSHMADVQLFGLDPGAGHLVNVALHALNAGLLLLVLDRLTGALWRSALVAAVFAVHPLHVESVAWVAERKDLLAGLFFMLTVMCYLWRLRRPGARSMHWVTASLALGLMAKPMLVTLPLVLLLLDQWPLGRVRPGRGAREYLGALRPLVREKLALLALSVAASALTLAAQARYGAVRPLAAVPFGNRLANAIVSLTGYLEKALDPRHLAAFYPYARPGLPGWQILVAGAVLAGLTAVAVRERRRRPYLLVGWLWYVGMLVPVIGLVQVGAQAMADRYAYLPLIGASVAAAWVVPGAWPRRESFRAAALGLALLTLGVLAGATRVQTRLWGDWSGLLRHTLAVTGDNPLTHYRLGQALGKQGRWEEALTHLHAAVRLAPDPGLAYTIGLFLQDHGRPGEAVAFLREAVTMDGDFTFAHFVLGLILARQGEYAPSAAHLREAVAQDPGFVEARYQLGLTLAQGGELEEAARSLSDPLVLNSVFSAQAHYNLGVVLEQLGRREEAEGHFREGGGRR